MAAKKEREEGVMENGVRSYALAPYRQGQPLSGPEAQAQIDLDIEYAILEARKVLRDAMMDTADLLAEHIQSFESKDLS